MAHRQYQHVGSFFLLFLLLTWRPESLVAVDTYVHLSVKILAVYAILAVKIHWTVGYIEYWRQHKRLLSLLIGYHLIILASLLHNLDRYESIAQWLVQGWGFVAIQSTLIFALLLFTLPLNTRAVRWSVSEYRYAPVLLLLIVALCLATAIWQHIDGGSALQLEQYFVAGYDQRSFPQSVFAAMTDWGSIAALTSCALLLISVRQESAPSQRMLLVVLAGWFAWAGFAGNSANFFLTVMVFFLLCVLLPWQARLWPKVVVLFSGGVAFFVAAIEGPVRYGAKVGEFLPMVLAIRRQQCINWSDGLLAAPDWRRALAGRNNFWSDAVSAWLESPWLGLSNGGMRLAESSMQSISWLDNGSSHNTHSIALQLLVDTGLIGLLVLVLTMVWVYRAYLRCLPRWQRRHALVFGGAVLASLSVDYFPDHALSWNVVVAYLFALVVAPSTVSGAQAVRSSSGEGLMSARNQLLLALSVFALSSLLLVWRLWVYVSAVPGCFGPGAG